MTTGTAILTTDTDYHHAERGLSPRRVRFWIVHHEELASLAFGGRGTFDLAEHLSREWERLCRLDAPPPCMFPYTRHWCLCSVCLCGRSDYPPPAIPAAYGGGSFGPPSGRWPDLYIQLIQAADALPLPWRATRAVFEQMDRSDVWAARLATRRLHDALRTVDREIEPPGSSFVVVQRMALSTGWEPRREVA